MYLHENVIFVCDIVLVHDDGNRVAPFGTEKRSLTEAVERTLDMASERHIELACGWNSVTLFSRWKPALAGALRDLRPGAGEDDGTR